MKLLLFILSFSVFSCLLQAHAVLGQIRIGRRAEGDTLITSQFFGFDFWTTDVDFWMETFEQLQEDSLQFGLVGVDNLTWNVVEPDPPDKGVHHYDWQVLDTAFRAVAEASQMLELTIRPVSDWGTIVPVDAMTGDACCWMSPIKKDADSDTEAWGMTAHEAWHSFVFNLVERYDGDGLDDAPGIDRKVIRHLMLGNEPEAPGHFFLNGGSVGAYHQMLQATFDAAKTADPEILVVRGKSNFGNVFDDAPDSATVLAERNRAGFIDSLLKSLDAGGEHYDLFGINFNDHHTGLEHITNWLSSEMSQRAFANPFLVADARTTLFSRDNSDDSAILPPRYPAEFMQILDDPSHAEYSARKKVQQADEVRQSISKILWALATGQRAISLQPIIGPLDPEYSHGDKRYMWLYAGLFDPFVYETTGDLREAREPVYFAVKQLMDAVIGASSTVEKLQLGENVFAAKLTRRDDDLLFLWHEDPFVLDEAKLVRRHQEITVDVRGVFADELVRVRSFVTELDSENQPVFRESLLTPANAVPIDEMPLMVEPPALVSSVSSRAGTLPSQLTLYQNYPNPFNPTTKIQFFLPRSGHVSLKIFNIAGQEVVSLVNTRLSKGSHTYVFEAGELSIGVYFFQIQTIVATRIRKMLLLL